MSSKTERIMRCRGEMVPVRPETGRLVVDVVVEVAVEAADVVAWAALPPVRGGVVSVHRAGRPLRIRAGSRAPS